MTYEEQQISAYLQAVQAALEDKEFVLHLARTLPAPKMRAPDIQAGR